MAGKTATRVVVAAALVGAAAYFAPEALDTVGTFLGDAVGAGDAVTLGEGETASLVAANAEAKLVNCEPETIVKEKSCDGLRILVVISRPDLVASAPYAGVDVAKVQGRC